MVECANFAEKREGFDIAAEKNVLPVVHALARVPVDERSGPSPEAGARLEHQDLRAVLHEAHGRAEAREPGPDHNRIPTGHAGHSHCLRAMNACSGRARRTFPANTS